MHTTRTFEEQLYHSHLVGTHKRRTDGAGVQGMQAAKVVTGCVPACAVKAAGLQASSAGQASRMRRRLQVFSGNASIAQHTSSTCNPARRLADCMLSIPYEHCRSHGDCQGTARLSQVLLMRSRTNPADLMGPLQTYIWEAATCEARARLSSSLKKTPACWYKCVLALLPSQGFSLQRLPMLRGKIQHLCGAPAVRGSQMH